MRLLKLIYTFCLLTLLNGCTENVGDTANNQEATTTPQTIADTFLVEPDANSGDLQELFTFHRKLQVNNDISFDVLGIGKTARGNYLILKSDKRNGTYASITGDKQGRLIHSYATDMDSDQQIEVIIFTKTGNQQRGNLIIHEIDSLNNHTEITLPDLTPDVADGYQGQDTFYVAGNKIIREFPVFPKDSAGQANANRRHIEYVLKNNALLPSAQGKE